MNKETLSKTQPTLYRFFKVAREKNRLPHALLLYGEENAPLLSLAIYLAKSLNCETSIFACDNCLSCSKFEKGIHPDFILIDGRNKVISKAEIDELENKFELGSTETGRTMVYILNEVENITEEASNALLKFLEEPNINVIAILTTSNITKVLPTIHSRCMPLYILNNSEIYNYVYSKTENKLLSFFINKITGDYTKADELLETDEFIDLTSNVNDFINLLAKDFNDCSFYLLNRVAAIYKDTKCYNYFYKLTYIALMDLLSSKNNMFNVSENFIDKSIINEIIDIVNNALTKTQGNLSFIGVISRICEVLTK